MEALVILGAVYLLTRQNAAPEAPKPPAEKPYETTDKRVKEWVDYAAELIAKGVKIVSGSK